MHLPWAHPHKAAALAVYLGPLGEPTEPPAFTPRCACRSPCVCAHTRTCVQLQGVWSHEAGTPSSGSCWVTKVPTLRSHFRPNAGIQEGAGRAGSPGLLLLGQCPGSSASGQGGGWGRPFLDMHGPHCPGLASAQAFSPLSCPSPWPGSVGQGRPCGHQVGRTAQRWDWTHPLGGWEKQPQSRVGNCQCPQQGADLTRPQREGQGKQLLGSEPQPAGGGERRRRERRQPRPRYRYSQDFIAYRGLCSSNPSGAGLQVFLCQGPTPLSGDRRHLGKSWGQALPKEESCRPLNY